MSLGPQEQRRRVEATRRRVGLTAEQLWKRYFALGGAAGPDEVAGFLGGQITLPAVQRDLLARAVNERLDELAGVARAPYSRVGHGRSPGHDPLAALVALLDGMHRAPSDRLPAVAVEAGRALGFGVRVWLVDYEQVLLHPASFGDGPYPQPLGVDSTLAGRAFRFVEILSSAADGRPRLWVPLLDGVERLGVVEIRPADGTDLDSPALREQCRWFAALLGHLVVATSGYGDGLDAVRRRRPRSASAELVWQLLPPTTAGTQALMVAGVVEPSDRVGGDAFDHALSETTAHLAIFDGAGHSLSSGLAVAAALSAYRSTRRNGGGLYEQARTVDEALVDAAPADARYVTAVLAELDVPSGRLRYIVGSHPAPLLMRDGKVVKTLRGGRRRLFGLPDAELTVGEETLQAGDWLVLHTDGITEARDQAGAYFGEDRLVDFLRREAAAGHPPPETVRRLVHAVLDHQDGVLQDDATVLLARWSG